MKNPKIRQFGRILCAVVFVCLFGLLALKSGSTIVNNNSFTPLQPQGQGPITNYGFADPTPSGNWSATADFDLQQTEDANNPVVIVGLRSYAGKGAWGRQLMVDTVTIHNRTAVPVSSVKLGWIILNAEGRASGKNRAAALLQGKAAAIKRDDKS
jgi:hypothetical protein